MAQRRNGNQGVIVHLGQPNGHSLGNIRSGLFARNGVRLKHPTSVSRRRPSIAIAINVCSRCGSDGSMLSSESSTRTQATEHREGSSTAAGT